jgi:hypothetical protein
MRTRRARSPVAQLALDLAAAAGREPDSARPPTAPSLTDAHSQAIAQCVVDMLREEGLGSSPGIAAPVPDGARYVKAEQLMERYQVSMKFIRSHAAELGPTRLSDAANSKLRYHLPTGDAFIASHRKHPTRAGTRRRAAQRSHTPNGVPLVPFT